MLECSDQDIDDLILESTIEIKYIYEQIFFSPQMYQNHNIRNIYPTVLCKSSRTGGLEVIYET